MTSLEKKTGRGLVITSSDLDGVRDKISKKEYLDVNIKTYSTKYKINDCIIKNDKLYVTEFNLNDGSIFILPLLFENKDIILFDYNFINLYLRIDESEVFSNQVYLVFRYVPFEYYFKFIEGLQNINTSDLEYESITKDIDPRFDIVCFNIKAKGILESIKLIMQGKFLNLFGYYKRKIINFNNNEHLAKILLNDVNLRRQYELRYEVKTDSSIALYNKPKLKELTWQK